MPEKDEEKDEETWTRVIIESFIIFAIIVVIPYLLSGIWPPFVSVISGSMEPNMVRGDMVLVVDQNRYEDANAIYGIEDKHNATELDFSKKGDVIVYYPNGNRKKTPIIHRAIYYTAEGENWVKDVDNKYLKYNDCDMVANCPAPNSGFITLGDANNHYDQEANLSKPVKPEWVIGRAQLKIPYIGNLRLAI